MALSCAGQFVLLLWKNWLLQKRRIVLTVFLILIPSLLALILLLIRTRVSSTLNEFGKVWDSFEADTALPVNLSLPCNVNWKMTYVPNSTFVKKLVSNAANQLDRATISTNGFGVIIGRGFSNEAQLEAYFADPVNARESALCGIVFSAQSLSTNGSSLLKNTKITYKIRMRAEGYNNGSFSSQGATSSSDSGWQTGKNFARVLKPGPRGDEYGGTTPGYYYRGFLAVQRAMDLSIISELGSGLNSTSAFLRSTNVKLNSFPYPKYLDDNFLFILVTQFPFIIMISFIVIAPTICKDIVLEKEKKLKESMKLMGLKVWVNWSAWFVKFAIFMIISVLFMTLFFHIKVKGSAVINFTDPSVTFVFLLLYTLSIITFCFAISTFFSKASAAAAAGGILYLVTYIPFFFLGTTDQYPTLSAGTKAGCSIFSNLAMGIGCWTIASFESTGAGVQWSTLNKTVNIDDNFTMLYVFLFLIFDTLWYAVFAWYFDALFPGDFGTPLPFYFPFTKWYWCGRSAEDVEADLLNTESIDYGDKKDFFEEDASSSGRVGIRIRNLTKKFSKIQRPAVSKLNIDMYEGQITALLGHNGAGKTTTMFMLTGFLPPSSGTAFINGFDLRTDLPKIRENLGLCPQHDVLFDTMTVAEHLTFFAKLKGCPSSNVRSEVDNMIHVLGLNDKRDVASKKLSGGMKRKLSVGIALIAGSKFVILDEPTSGMDPEARRQAWDILQSQRAGRTMILSTHFMDEADLLGDRIAIMAEGQLQCCGTSLFLKGKYGIGYHLTVVKNPSCNVDRVVERVLSHVAEGQVESNVGAELSFILPRERSNRFEQLFTDLEQNRHELGIDSFGASVTTLEEVFLKVGEICDAGLQRSLQNGNGDDSNKTGSSEVGSTESLRRGSARSENQLSYSTSSKSLNGSRNQYDDDEVFGVGFRRVSGFARLSLQFKALFIKHMIHSMRNVKLTVVQILLPVIFTIIACIVQKTVISPTDPPPLPLNLSYFPQAVIPVSMETNASSQMIMLKESFEKVAAKWAQVNDTQNQEINQHLIAIASDIYRYNRNYLVAGNITVFNNTGGIKMKSNWTMVRNIRCNDTNNATVTTMMSNPNTTISNTGGTTEANKISTVNGMGDATVTGVASNPNTTISNTGGATETTIISTVNNTGDATPTTTITGFFNNIALHAIATSLSIVDNALLQFLASQDLSDGLGDATLIETINHPLPRTVNTRVSDEVATASTVGFTFAYLVSFGMSFLVATFIVYVVNERAVKAKQAQFIAGVDIITFWTSGFLWDALCFLIPSILIIIVIAAFQTSGYSSYPVLGIIFFDLVFYGWSVLPFAYLLSFLFNVASTAYTWILVINIFTGTVAVLAVFILELPALGVVDVGKGLEWLFYILLPNFCFNKAIQDLYYNYQYGTICAKTFESRNKTTFCDDTLMKNQTNLCCPNACGSQCDLTNDNYLSWERPGIGRSIVFMFLQGLVFFVVLWLLEFRILQRFKNSFLNNSSTVPVAVTFNSNGEEEVVELSGPQSSIKVIDDSDVRTERERISRTPNTDLVRTDKVILRELTKFYNGTFLAVDRLSVGIPDGECFGLLGVNGAGKTTTFKMLIGDETLSAGDATLDGISVQQDVQSARERVGYCPQFDALIDQMTVTETLWMYARLRGVAEEDIGNLVEKMIEQLTLTKHAKKQARNLSGGNRRKLSVGIALIGSPSIVFLDEPTTGMDPVARRLLWNTLSTIRDSGRTLVLTSHSMEECEALCTRMAIMVNGRFQCLGSTQHLKAKFGEGYSLIIKVRQGGWKVEGQQIDGITASTGLTSGFERNTESSEIFNGVPRSKYGLEQKTQRVMDFVRSRFPGSQLKDQHDGLLHYRVLPDNGMAQSHSGMPEVERENDAEKSSSQQQVSWAYVFGEIERAKDDLDIEDYSVSQTTLEQVFISFARMQRPPQEVGVRTFCGCQCVCCLCCKKKDD